MRLEKTDVMWVGRRREDLNITLDGNEIKQVKGLVYFGGIIMADG